jgi:isopentenyl diphosphate isomerase/L-lactate dehydrogenase-like FMN-dependent dehydrogenase
LFVSPLIRSSASSKVVQVSQKKLARLYNVTVARERAKAVLPRVLFDYVDGGADDEVTLRANRTAFEDVTFRPRVATDVGPVDLSTTVLGARLSMPVVLAPCGGVRLLYPDGDRAVIRAAGAAGTASVMSTAAATAVEDVMAAATGPAWFQLYFHGGREQTEQLVARAQSSGASALFVTVDTAVRGNHERIKEHETVLPLKPTLHNAIQFAPQLSIRPRWTYRYVRDGLPTNFGSFPTATKAKHTGRAGGTWDDLTWIRQAWNGPLVIKGILTPEDAERAIDRGADAIVVSNHGGRQLDGAPATLRVLPEIRRSVGDRIEVLVDGGVRRGTDVVKAIASGADAVLIGRPYLYGLASAGQAGVEQILRNLHQELVRTMTLIGCGSVAAIGPDVIAGPMGAVTRAAEPVM